MANTKKKTTVKEDAVNENVSQAEEFLAEEKKVEETVQSDPEPIQGDPGNRQNAIEVKPATGEEEDEPGDVPTEDKFPSVNDQLEPEEPGNLDEITEEVEKVAEELNEFSEDLEKKVEEVQAAEPEKVVEVAKQKLSEIEEIEKGLQAEIEKEENNLSEQQKKNVKRLFGRGFGDFWNGISSGWEN